MFKFISSLFNALTTGADVLNRSIKLIDNEVANLEAEQDLRLAQLKQEREALLNE